MLIEQIILVIHVLIALAIVGLILLQQGKGADMGASFGGGGSQTLFGPAGGGNVLTRATAILATAFFVTSFGLAIIAKQKASEVNAADDLAAGLSEAAVVSDIEAELEALGEAAGADTVSIPVDIIESADPVDDIPQ